MWVGHPLDLIKVRQQCLPAPSPPSLALELPYASGATTKGSASVRLPFQLLSSSSPVTAAPSPSPSTSTLGMFRSILRADGFRGLYAGVSAPLLAVVPAFGITFGTFEAAKKHILLDRRRQPQQRNHQQHSNQLTISETAMAGAASGLPLALVLGPLERIKCQRQLQTSPSSSNAVLVSSSSTHLHPWQTVTASTPTRKQPAAWRSFFKGTGITVARDVPGNAVYFASYEFFRRLFGRLEQDHRERSWHRSRHNDHANAPHHSHSFSSSSAQPSIGATLLAGGLAGVANWMIALPLDVVKTAWQVSPDHGPERPTGPWDVACRLHRQHGYRAFFRGLGPALLRAFPANAACLLGVETARRVLPVTTASS